MTTARAGWSPDAVAAPDRVVRAAAKLLEEQDALAAMDKAVANLATAARLLGQLASIAELAVLVMQGKRTGVVEFRTGI
ncbi:hypothetical protein [Dactylosporangium sp. NPDC005555]|uniref:hypothetical protein n=1 Tax=Dactylosporangium sp. NPDC005555 TaxID=3154889 RepID=UPI0033BA8B1E